MALKFTRKPTDYISETAYMYDVAKTSQYFDKSVYEGLAATGDQEAIQQYVYGIAGAKDKTLTDFNQHDYDYLSAEDKASYTLTMLYGDKDSNDYKQAMEYFNYKVQESIDKETYNSLNAFQKTMASIGGIVGNALNETIFGTIEGLVDLGGLIVGGTAALFGADEFAQETKEFIAEDFTGVGANREALQRYARAYTYLDKNKFWSTANDVVTGISQMVPMIAGNIVAPGLGTGIYFSAMAGNTAADAIRTNPDINYLALIGYTATVTGVEFATEKISAGLFGGAGNFIDNMVFGVTTGKGLTKLGQKAAGSWVARVGLNFLSEGLEESVAEFADTALFNVFVAQGNDKLRKSYSISDILYAGIVGGLIGGLMEGGRIATQQRLSVTETGEVISSKLAKQLGVTTTKDLSKLQSLTFTEQLSQAKALVEKDAVADLQTKYSDLSLQEIQEQHADEYQKAVETNKKISDQMTEIALGLNRVYELAGEEGFQRATELANGVFENQQRLISNYVAKSTGVSAQNRAVENAVKKIYGENVSFTVNDSLNAQQLRLKQNLKNRYGVDVYFGNLGDITGANQKFGLTISENTIIIDEAQMGQMSEQEILNTLVKEELVHALQFIKGVITPKTLFEINRIMGNTEVAKQNLGEAYAEETALTKLTEAQAKAVAEVLLFDELTVSKMFYTQYSTLNKVYRFFKNIKTKLEESKELRSQKGKMKYHELLESMKMYRDIAAEKLGTAENVEQFIKDYQLSLPDQDKLKKAYIENPSVEPIEKWAEAAAFAVEREGLSQEARDILYNEDGTPKTFYKGTNEKGITKFDSTKGKKKRETNASWFTSSLEVAKSYANEKIEDATIYSIDLSQITNPKIIDAVGERWDIAFEGKSTDDIVREAIAENAGYDAVIITNVVDPGTYSTSRELLKPATDIAVIDTDKINILKEEPKRKLEAKTPALKTKDGAQVELDLEAATQKLEEKAKRKRIRKTSEGVQLSVFDYIDESMPVGEREATRLKAIEQEIPYNQLKPTQAVLDKANKIKELCSELAQSEYQGDIENHKFATLSNEIFEKGADLFGDITSDEWQAIRGVLFMDLADPRASAALNAVTRYAYLHRANQFTSISELVKTLYANSISSSGQLIGLSAHDYNNHSVQSFVTELAMKNQVEEIPLPDDLILNTVPEFESVDAFKKSLAHEIDTLKKQAKETKDAYDKWELNRRASSKERVLTALYDNDIAVAIDEQLTMILESNENVSENLQKQNATYKALIEWLLTHADFDKQNLKGFSEKKIPLSKNLEKAKTFFEGLESFRYMMMLSNPATAAKNAISNTLILGQGYVEDFGTKFFEKKKWLSEAQQVKYTGEYDQAFSQWVNDNYLEKVKSDAEGDKYTSSELRRLQQQYAEAKDPIKKNKLLNSIQTFERKLLNDKFWVTHRTMRNLKNTLAGSSDLILAEARSWLVAKYRGTIKASEITDVQLIEKISKTNKELSSLFEQASSGDKVAIMKLATKLNLDIISPDLKQQGSIYYHSFYRANKMFFKIDNWFTRVMSNLNQKHPAMAYIVRHFMPFVRVTANSTSYIIDRSPIGLAKGIFKALQTKVKWQYQMQSNIEQYYRQQYSKIMSQKDIDFKFNQSKFDTWLNETVDTKTKQALSGDKQALTEVFNAMVKEGMINSGSIGSDDLYARAEIMEQISQGVTGTALIGLGLLLGAITDAFEYDDDDEYLGPVIKLGDIKIGLGELSPFSTLFTMSAMLTSDKVDNKIEAAFNIFADATILSTLDSALSYSDGVWDYLKNQSINIVAQYQPAITKAISKLIYNRKKDKSGDWGTKLIKTLGANSLIFNYLVPNKINPYTGKPEKYYDTGWFEGLFDIALPIGVRVDGRSELEKEAETVGAQTTGLSGKFTINNVDYKLTNKTKEKYAKYKAQYVNDRFERIKSGAEKVTIKDNKTGKYKTTTYDKLTDEEKSRVLKNLYSTATEITKIQYWLDEGNYYYTTDKDTYREYKKLFGSSAKIVYRVSWSKSKFVEG